MSTYTVSYLSIDCSSDVDASSNHKHGTHLSIVEEGENSDTPVDTLLQSAEKDHELSSVTSSAENINLAANTRANQQSLYSLKNSSNRLNDIHENSNSNSRRPSVVLQEIFSTRRPSAIMASLRRGSHSILSNFRKHEDPNDPAKTPEAVEYRRKNRRIGE
jgi:hypothetical protein